MIKKLYSQYKELVLYIFFGGCTTLVNLLSYAVCTRVLHINLISSTVAAWLLSVIFAYITNRKYVFLSKNNKIKAFLLEFAAFIGCRISTGALDVAIMYVFVNKLGYPDLLIKIISNAIVIISNYLVSRLLIFKLHNDTK